MFQPSAPIHFDQVAFGVMKVEGYRYSVMELEFDGDATINDIVIEPVLSKNSNEGNALQFRG